MESACFNAGRTSHTSRDLSLISDASIRFERQVDETGCVDVANLACSLIEELAGGEVAPGCVDVYPAPREVAPVELRLARVHAICGADIAPDFIERSLTRLGCNCLLYTSVLFVERAIELISSVEIGAVKDWRMCHTPVD